MPHPARDRLAHLLAGTEPPRADSAMLRLPSDMLSLEVADLGPITTPIRAPQAKRLIGAARPAQFGRGEETLRDSSVRNTWELTPGQVILDGPSWHAQLDAALEHFRDELALPAGSRLTAELHSMLVYGKGQFFLPHRDSEKHDEMVATLVVMLPSVHTGGELVVDDRGHEQVYVGSRDDLVLVAFYADRRHEVRPVRSGYRVSLTFNLLLTEVRAPSAAGPVAQLAAQLNEHFSTRVKSPYGGRDLGTPARLAFLLDHEYTQRGLRAGLLKGVDAERVARLRAAAEQSGCQAVLALAEIKETWDALPVEDSWHRDWYDEDDDEPDLDDDDVELNELIDDEITLSWWVNLDGSGAETIRLSLSDHEVCAVTPTHTLAPYETEHEGYMGNYGNTQDRWYRRAALVLWPTERGFAARAEAGSAWALQTILDRIDEGELDGARRDAAALEPFWRELDPALLEPALRVAVGLRDRATARVALAPFRLEAVRVDHAVHLAALGRAHDDSWLQELLDTWVTSNTLMEMGRRTWVTENLLVLCQALHEQGAPTIADSVIERVWCWLASRIEGALRLEHPDRRRAQLGELAVPLARVLEAASDGLAAIIAEVLRVSGERIDDLLVPALRVHERPSGPALVDIANDCCTRLTARLDRPERATADWSIPWTGCGCPLCDRLADFLQSPSLRTHEWPLAKPGRQHLHQHIDAADLPVRHTTRRHGRPYTLVLAKTEDLFRRETEVRRRAQADLEWLESEFGKDDPRTD